MYNLSYTGKGVFYAIKKILKGIEYTVYAVLFILTIITIISVIQNGLFESIESIQSLITGTGVWGWIIFIFFQILQVVIPVIPGGIVNTTGVILYGPWQGFFLNFIGNLTGALIAFLLARRFGTELISYLFNADTVERYQSKLEEVDYVPVFLAIAVALPGFPDGLLIYLTGIVTKLSVAKFMIIMILGRGTSMIVYSIGIDNILRFLENTLQ